MGKIDENGIGGCPGLGKLHSGMSVPLNFNVLASEYKIVSGELETDYDSYRAFLDREYERGCRK